MAFVGEPPFELPDADEVHISVAFTWDRLYAEHLRRQWANYFDIVVVGGPAQGDPGGNFKVGRYLRPGYTITSRGCPNRCGFCLAWRREGSLRTLPIQPGHIILDNNLLACPRSHIEAVLNMVSHQRCGAEFTGGLEAARVEPWFVKAVTEIGFKRAYFAYDRPSERKAVGDALRLFIGALPHIKCAHSKLSVYVLVGYDGDTIAAASERCQFVKDSGGVAYPMLFCQEDSSKRNNSPEWRDFVGRLLSRPGNMRAKEPDSQRGLFADKEIDD